MHVHRSISFLSGFDDVEHLTRHRTGSGHQRQREAEALKSGDIAKQRELAEQTRLREEAAQKQAELIRQREAEAKKSGDVAKQQELAALTRQREEAAQRQAELTRQREAEAKKQAQYYLDAIEAEYRPVVPASFSYAGFQRIQPDGAIQQVTWTVDASGYATTQASRHREDVRLAPTYAEKRFNERISNFLAFDAILTGRQSEQKRAKARA